MILELAARRKKTFAAVMLALLYIETVLPANALAATRMPVTTIANRKFTTVDEDMTPHHRKAVVPSAAGITSSAKGITPFTKGSTFDAAGLTSSAKGLTPPAAGTTPTSSNKTNIGGPTQPESQAFSSVNGDNMVDLFSGDFSYKIPLLDVGGYPIALGYNSGVSMDQEPSWVGLGWNINPGTITRNLRGLPDDFDGVDSIRKVQTVKPTKTWGVNLGVGFELFGKPSDKARSASDSSSIGNLEFGLAFTYNNYRGFGIESSISPSLNAGSKTFPGLSGGLSLTNSSTDGLTSGISLFEQVGVKKASETNTGAALSASVSGSYNTRAGLKDLQFSAGDRLYRITTHNNQNGVSGAFNTSISFARPAYMPDITMPFTGTAFSFTAKIGTTAIAYHPYIRAGYNQAEQKIAAADTALILPAFGYLNYQNANGKPGSLLDYNIEKEISYREKPAIPTIGIPAYTYDVWSISGEGSGGMFRAYRGDIGYVFDHQMKTKDGSISGSIDLGFGQTFHWGGDFNLTRASSENTPWTALNYMALSGGFKNSNGLYEASYFRNPGESTVNDKNWHKALGGDDVVTVRLSQSNSSDSKIYALSLLDKYKAFKRYDSVSVTNASSGRTQRDKRTQVISYLTAEEASTAGLSKYIDNYGENKFPLQSCDVTYPSDLTTDMQGLRGDYYAGRNFDRFLFSKTDKVVNFGNLAEIRAAEPASPILNTRFTVRWTGRLKTDVTGRYVVYTRSDDGIRLYINDSLVLKRWTDHPDSRADSAVLNLVAGENYKLVMEYYQKTGRAVAKLQWKFAGLATQSIPSPNLYLEPTKDTFHVSNDDIAREKRINTFRKSNHISEINVLNADGRRYVYGVPVYNFLQKDVTFSVDASRGDDATGLVSYTAGTDNTVDNQKGNDWYFNKEETPAYPHSFLLSAILSPDYVDLTGDGITSDDQGDAIRFNYTKIADKNKPEKWRVPYNSKANYNHGLQTDNRDDKGSYVYGEKELWYLNSIESKNMIAIFWIHNRQDLPGMDENGNVQAIGQHKKLDSIALYSKSDFLSYGTKALAIKTVHFEYTDTLCRGAIPNDATKRGKLTLSKVWFSYNGNQRKDKNAFVFNYNSNNPEYKSNYYDRWGNYKNPAQNPGSLNNAEYPYALQDSTQAAANAAAWTLDQIKLPSGASIKVDYESDDYAFVQNKRAAQMFRIAGFSAGIPSSQGSLKNELYSLTNEYTYVGINVPKPVTSNQDLYARYLEGMDTLFFKVFVKMPTDKFGNGSEYVNCYATIEPGNYGSYNNGFSIWLKLQPVNKAGEVVSGGYNPVAKAAIQFLRLNLPSKAYPGSQTGDDLTPLDGAKMLLSQVTNLTEMFTGFDKDARIRGWAKSFDTSRSFVRLANPYLKKYGGGLRVKKVSIYDNWNAMTQQKQAVYGQEYTYTTTKSVAGKTETISSGVASWEPTIGGEENPWRVPIQYKEQAAVLAPVSNGYVEKPLGETFFPGASVGYSKVRVRSINTKNKRSANGYAETSFYTSYDFPTLTDMTPIGDNKKRFKPALANLLKIDAKHYMAVSQGFKVELNDMNGKIKSQAVYSESDPDHPISYTENYYRVDNFKHLNNTVRVINDKGIIDTAASVGKDVELMMSMRQQRSVTNAFNLNINSDGFLVGAFFALIPSLLNIAQREETIFRVLGTTKVVNRHGLLDSIVVIEKGSRVVTRNLVYDGETGDVVLSSSRNEYNEPVYHLAIPAGWLYDGMSGAYKNIGVTADKITIKEGKIVTGLDNATIAKYFAAGDEILVFTRQKTGGTDCTPEIATWPALSRIYAVDANAITGGDPNIYFVDKDGAPFTGTEVTMKVTRSGRRNIAATAGEMTMLKNPVVNDTTLVVDASTGVLTATATEFNQFWKVADKKKMGAVTNCVQQSYAVYSKDSCGLHVYGNDSLGGWYNSNACAASSVSNPVYYHIDRDMYSSTVSQQAANAIAKAALDSLGPVYAAMYSTCLYPNKYISRRYVKNDCPVNATPDTVLYEVPYNTYRELTQEQADADAAADTLANGQKWANDHGTCAVCNFFVDRKPDTETDALPPFEILAVNNNTGVTYRLGGSDPIVRFPQCMAIPAGGYTVKMSAMEKCYAFPNDSGQYILANNSYQTYLSNTPITVFMSMHPRIYNPAFPATKSKNDCGTGYQGSEVSITIPANTAYSYVSEDEARAKALAIYANSLQTTANAQGICLDATHMIVRKKASASTSPYTLITYKTTSGTASSARFDGDQLSIALSQSMWEITLSVMAGTGYFSVNGGATQTMTSAGTTIHVSGPPITIDIWNP